MTRCVCSALAPLLALVGAGCSNAPSSNSSSTSQTFYPSAASFSNFCSWQNAPATNDEDASDGLHGVGPLVVYWNHSPPHGSTSFPVGTIILKTDSPTDPTQRTIFGMVKVGAGYNSEGAAGWEWFSLTQDAACDQITILWNGAFPPPSESYAGMAIGNCNGCHETAGNDAVWDSALKLTNF